MSERFDRSSPEFDSSTLAFGDLIRCKTRYPTKLHMTTNVYEDGSVGGFIILDSESNTYSLPGTIPRSDILSTHGSVPYEQAIEMAAHSIAGGNEGLLDIMRALVIKHHPEQP